MMKKYVHELFFRTEAKARVAQPQVMRLIDTFISGNVRKGGQRAGSVVGQKPPRQTWRYVFVTSKPMFGHQMDQIHDATDAEEGQWNQFLQERKWI